jgi:hypothetical protein
MNEYMQDVEEPQLYLARFERQPGRIKIKGEIDERDIAIGGEMVVAGRLGDDKTLIVDEIRRVSLGSEPVEALGSGAALAGPLEWDKVEPGPAGSIEPFAMRLYYALLSELKPGCVDSDAAFPQLEAIEGRLTWEPEPADDAGLSRMRVTIVLDKLIEQTDPPTDAVEMIALRAAILTFEPITAAVKPTLRTTVLDPCGQPAPGGSGHYLCDLKVRFIKLFDPPPADLNLMEVVETLIAGACEVWWVKGGVRIVATSLTTPLNPQVDLADQAALTLFPTGQVALGQETWVPAKAGQDLNSVNVYLAAALTGPDREGGGFTYECQTNKAYVLLDIRKARYNRYLLAHELGHVLGLRHPGLATGGCKGTIPGSFCSVMVPGSPNSSRNTTTNLNVLPTATNPPASPLWPVLVSLSTSCGYDPDLPDPAGFAHVVRDFAADDGTPGIAPQPPAQFRWTHSDVWNANQTPQLPLPTDLYNDGTPMFNDDFTPRHSEPRHTGPNSMLARVHTCETLNSAVSVHLFLAIPGAAPEPLRKLENANLANPILPPLNFSGNLLPKPGTPQTNFAEWTIPAGYPPNFCVFAVATSANEVTPPALAAIVANPAAHTFFDLFQLLGLNDVAQRNLHTQQIGVPKRVTFWSTLPWVHMTNPFKRVAAAHLVIDWGQARGLADLVLEVDDRLVQLDKSDGTIRFLLADALEPGGLMVLRLRARISPGLSEGMTLPIHLQFVVDDQVISGFTHLVQIAPLSMAVDQVLDRLVGALQDIGVGFQVSEATRLASSVARLMARYTDRPEAALASLRRLSGRFAQLASILDQSEAPEAPRVQRRLYELAGVLLNRSDRISTEQFIELIRDLADRLQETAGRLARAQA